MAKLEKANTRQIVIPVDQANEDFKVVTFTRDGEKFSVLRGEIVEVPEWVYESAVRCGYVKEKAVK